jgi:hypothetical protein
MRRSNRRFLLLALSALTSVVLYGSGNERAFRMRQLHAGKRRFRSTSRIFEQGSFTLRAVWEWILVLRRTLLDFVALPKTGRIGAEAMAPLELSETVAVQEEVPVKTTAETPLPDVSATAQHPQPSEPSVEEPITSRKPKHCKRRKSKADRTAKLGTALELLGEGRSRRAVAKTLGVAESTFRAWLKSERVACVPS